MSKKSYSEFSDEQKQRARDYQSALRKTPKGKYRVRAMNLKRFGLTPERYEEILEQQGGVCAVCGQPETKRNQFGVVSLAVDHDHETGQVRGLICMLCNRALGMLGDSPDTVRRLADYRSKYQRLYVAGPMTGLPDNNRPAFNAMAARLRAIGYGVLNPAENPEDDGAGRGYYMRKDIFAIIGNGARKAKVDFVAVIPGWEKSRGARLEVEVALQLDIPVVWAESLADGVVEPVSQTYLDTVKNDTPCPSYFSIQNDGALA